MGEIIRETVYVRRASGLVRELGMLESLSVALSGAIGAGINVLVLQGANLYPGANVPLGYVLVGIMTIPLSFVIAHIAGDLPRSSALYVFVSRTLHPLLGFLGAWGVIVSSAFVIGTLSRSFAVNLGPFLVLAGRAAKSDSLIGAGQFLMTDAGILLTSFIMIVAFLLIFTFGARVYGKFMDIIFIIPLIGFAISLILFATTPSGSIRALYDATWGSGAYDEIVRLGTKYGYTPEAFAFSWGATFSIMSAAVFAYQGFERAAYVAGEVKSPKKTIMYSMFGGTILLFILYSLTAILSWGLYGDWIIMYNIAITKGVKELLINPPARSPFVAHLAASLIPAIPALQIFLYIAGLLWLFNTPPTRFLVASRTMFAMSFDRFLPEKVAYVHPKTGSPLVADFITFILGVVGIIFAHYLGIYAAAISATLFDQFLLLLVMIGAIVYPFVKEEAWKAGYRYEYKGFPVITIVGVVTVAIQFIIYYLCVSTTAREALTFGAIWYALGVIVFVYYYWKNKQRGIDPNLIFGEIPPT
ncbi:MAG: APC family permease [Candidatus Methanomethylicia archaeon]